MKNQGIKLYNRAKKIIPSGTMLYSKKPELYLPDYWPTYFSKSKGWCATAAFEDEVTQSGDYNQPGSYNQSSIKCPPTHYRVPGKISMETESKTWCLKSE